MGVNIFKPTIETISKRCLYGNWMTMGVETLDRDYDLAWEVLAARIRPITSLVSGRFGLGTEARLGQPFNYWTAVELAAGAPVPAGMMPVVIPPGLYLTLGKNSQNSLAEAYDFAYNCWEKSQTEYCVNRSRLCFEQYEGAGHDSDGVTLFMPLASRDRER
jgi:hypothetical protein